MTGTLIALLFVTALVLAVYVLTFNGLGIAATKIEQGWAGIEVQLKRRHDLTPQLVSAVRSAMAHETAILSAILEAREKAMGVITTHDPAAVAESEAVLSKALNRLLAYAEDNPEITATANIRTLQKQLEETEDQIAAARRLYNGNVQNLNARIASFPGNLVANLHRFRTAAPFALARAEQQAANAVPVIDL